MRAAPIEPSPPPPSRARWLARLVLLLTAGGLAAWITCCALGAGARPGAVRFIPWQTWPPFGDLRIVLEALDLARLGVDPLRSPEALYNYPGTWLLLRHLGLTAASTPWLGLLLDFSFLACAVRIAWSAAPAAIMLSAAALATPPVMTALERANTDLIIFVLLSVSAGLAGVTRRRQIADLGLALAASLKFYPALAFPALGASSSRAWLMAGGLVAVGLTWQIPDIVTVLAKTPRSPTFSYGVLVPLLRLEKRGWVAPQSLAARGIAAVSLAGSASLAVAAFVQGRQAGRRAASGGNPPALSLLGAGGLIFGATFFLTSNWAYRLIFLLWCIPLLPWQAAHPGLRRSARLAAGAMVVLLWSFGWPAGGGFVLSYGTALAILALLSYQAGHLARFPRWLHP